MQTNDYFEELHGDSLVAAEVMKILGMINDDLYEFEKREKLDQVLKFFDGMDIKDVRANIVGKIAGKGENGLESIWRYVDLVNRKKELMGELNPEHFSDDIKDDIGRGNIPANKMQIIKDQIREKTSVGIQDSQSIDYSSVGKTIDKIEEISQIIREKYE